MNAIFSGVLLKGRAVAASMISMAVISKMPVILMATATITASASVKISCSRMGLIPQACARSSFKMAVSRADQRHTIKARTPIASTQTMIRFLGVTADILPNR